MKKILISIIFVLSCVMIFADLEIDAPDGYNLVGPSSSSGEYPWESEHFHVTNLGETAEFTINVVPTNLPDGWMLGWCHLLDGTGFCHMTDFGAWPFTFENNATIDLDITVINVDRPGSFEYTFIFDSESIDEPVEFDFTFRTSDCVDNDDHTLLNKPVVLNQNYPNPFNMSSDSRGNITTISYEINNPSKKDKLEIFNIKGEKVKTISNITAVNNKGTVTWNGLDENGKTVSSGIYYYRINGLEKSQLQKMTIIR